MRFVWLWVGLALAISWPQGDLLMERELVAAQVDGIVSPHGPLVALLPQVPPDGLEFFCNLCHRHRARFISHT
jgi:hypothetical protein